MIEPRSFSKRRFGWATILKTGSARCALSSQRRLRTRDEVRKRAYFERASARARHPGASGRHLDALTNHVARVDELRALDVPTLVVHGDLDPLIDISGGRRTAELIPGADFLEIEGFAHELAPQMWAPLISAVTILASNVEW